MSLAILRLESSDDERHSLVLDTGTSQYFRLHLGTEVRREHGFLLLASPYWSSPLQTNPRAGRHFDTRTRFTLDSALVTERGSLLQLESCRDPAGRGPAWSAPVRVPGGRPARPAVSAMSVSHLSAPAPARTLAVRSAAETFSRPASVGDLIGTIVQAAAPVVLELLNRPAAATSPDPTTSVLGDLLRRLLGALAAQPAAAGAVTVPAPAATPTTPGSTTATPQTLVPGATPNRFVPYTRPMVFGIDDALLASLAAPIISSVAGPLLEALPQLLNAANQQKLDRQALTGQQVQALLGEVNRSLLLQQLIDARSMPANPGVTSSRPEDADLAALQELLQQAATTAAPVGTATAQPASLPSEQRGGVSGPSPLASKALLTVVTGPAITRLGQPRAVFVRDQATTLRFRLDVGTSGPATPLPRAILEVCVREPGGGPDLLRRTKRVIGLVPGTELPVALTPTEVADLPTDTDLEVLASLRWPGVRGTYQCSGSQVVVLAARTHVQGRGGVVGDPIELTDLGRFRSFWNQVWSSSTGPDAPLWGLDVAMRYSVVTTASARGNTFMESRLQNLADDTGLRDKAEGRLKSGLEVSTHELNKLLSLWPGEQPLPDGDLAAFAAPRWVAGQGGDAVTQVRMEGRRGTHGRLWVVPVLKLRTFTLATATEVDPHGQVVATQTRPVRFPVVESVRILGLASLRDADEPGEAAEVGTSEAPVTYRFDGYDVVLHNLVGLDPARPLPAEPQHGAGGGSGG